jgi:hypothetical protein
VFNFHLNGKAESMACLSFKEKYAYERNTLLDYLGLLDSILVINLINCDAIKTPNMIQIK